MRYLRVATVAAAVLCLTLPVQAVQAQPASKGDWAELYDSLTTLHHTERVARAAVKVKHQLPRSQQCRRNDGSAFFSSQEARQTIWCATRALGVDTQMVLRIWSCESGWGTEPSYDRSRPYHGPFQYLPSTYDSQYAQQAKLARRYDLPRRVHNPRANIIVAVGYMRWSTSPWSCA